jgi:hypothetical protein
MHGPGPLHNLLGSPLDAGVLTVPATVDRPRG